jgi:hypothetical protein
MQVLPGNDFDTAGISSAEEMAFAAVDSREVPGLCDREDKLQKGGERSVCDTGIVTFSDLALA